MGKKRIVVLSGAGISADSGISTFRDSGGLWEKYDIMEVATYEAWQRNMPLVIEFYNQRRKQLYEVEPNAGHYSLVKLEEKFDVFVVTQNVDDLHERAGSKNVMHLHGELKKVRSSCDESIVFDLDGWELKIGDKCEKGSQLRPHIVWFGEPVPMIYEAAQLASTADMIIIVGTSLNVYPAAGLVGYAKQGIPIYLVDPGDMSVEHIPNLTVIKERGIVGVPVLVEKLLKNG